MNLNKHKTLLRDFIFVFCLVFSFYAGPIPFVQVSMLSGLICLCLICSKKEKFVNFLLLILNKKCRCVFISIFIIITNCFIFSSIHFTADISYVTSMMSLLFKIICTFAVVEVIYDTNKPMVYYEKIVIHICVVLTFDQG
jgi:hypothetical protein